MKQPILIALTSHDRLGSSDHPTGFWYEELAAAYYTFRDAGLAPVLVSPRGGRPPIDPGSEAEDARTESVQRFRADSNAQAALDGSTTAEAAPSDFAALFLVGGHGTMWDFPHWAGLGRLLGQAVARERPVGAVCHGVAGLLSLHAADGRPLVRGRKLTGFSNAEEEAIGLSQVVPFLLEDSLSAAGGRVETASPFAPHVVSDGLLVTGQNPASTGEVAARVLALLSLEAG